MKNKYREKDRIMYRTDFKAHLYYYIQHLDNVFDYPDVNERKNDVQQDIDEIVYEMINEYYNKT